MRHVGEHLGDADVQAVLRPARELAHHDPLERLTLELDGRRRGHPVLRLVAARVGMDHHRAVALDHHEPQRLGQDGGQAAGVPDLTAGDDQAHRARQDMAGGGRAGLDVTSLTHTIQQSYSAGMTVAVGAKGQVVIPKSVRDRIGLHPGDEVDFELREDDCRRPRPARASAGPRRPLRRQRHGRTPPRRTARASRGERLPGLLGDPRLARRRAARPRPRRGHAPDRPVVSWVNLVEVYYRVERDHGRLQADDVLSALRATLAPDLPAPPA
jgi:AbrB family looped-hinge helix DNA binding protein